MAPLTGKSNRLSALTLGVALALAPPALAQIVETPSAGSHWRVDDSTNSTTRLQVDEATGNISRNGALFVHTTGSNNTFVGFSAGNTSTSGVGKNSAFGYAALRENTTGLWNSAFGYAALRENTAGGDNSAFGSYALQNNLGGYVNSAFGVGALQFNTTGGGNSAVGGGALYDNTTGSDNSAVGFSALRDNTTGSDNSAVGRAALLRNTTGFRNSGFGMEALRENTTGSANSAVGSYALRSNTTGYFNSAVGSSALDSNTAGEGNSAVGDSALRSNSTGDNNSAFGRGALFDNTTGDFNSAVGYDALSNNSTGLRNVAVGRNAGRFQTTGSDNIYLANDGAGGESGQIKIGTVGTHSQAWLAGVHNNAAVSPDHVCVTSAGQLGLCSSSARFKEAVEDMGDASGLLAKLRPVTFRYKKEYTDGGDTRQYGLIAEEVAEVAPELVVTDAKGQPYSVRYNELTPMLLNEVQRQQQVIAELSSRLALLEGKAGAAGASEEVTR